MEKPNNTEYWLRGPLPNTPALLQPVAHALLQARDEINKLMDGFPENKLWEKPFGVASAGFHLQHLTGVLDRLFTYSNGEMLSSNQLAYLSAEGDKSQKDISVESLLEAFSKQVDMSIAQLNNTDEASLTETKYVGRAKIPTTKMGLLVHAAEHTMRHTGQLLVTVRMLNSK
jgi:uncharacterized damage-inducible protein DinB